MLSCACRKLANEYLDSQLHFQYISFQTEERLQEQTCFQLPSALYPTLQWYNLCASLLWKVKPQKSEWYSGVHLKGLCIKDFAEPRIRPSDRGRGQIYNKLAVSDRPRLSDGCCRHRSVHHALVKAPLFHPPPFLLKVNTAVSPLMYLRAHRHPHKTCRHASTGTHMQRTHTDTVPIMVTNPAWAGSHLWVMSWCVVPVKLPRHLPFTDGSAGWERALSCGHDGRTVWKQTSYDPDQEQSHISWALRC